MLFLARAFDVFASIALFFAAATFFGSLLLEMFSYLQGILS